MMEQRQNTAIYAANLTDLLAASYPADGEDRTSVFNTDSYADTSPVSPTSTLDDGDSSQSAFGVDLTAKGTNLAGKSFTIAAILGLTNAEDDVMNLSVQERLQQNQRQLQNYFYANHDMQRLNSGFCRSVVGMPPAVRQGEHFKPTVYPLLKNEKVYLN